MVVAELIEVKSSPSMVEVKPIVLQLGHIGEGNQPGPVELELIVVVAERIMMGSKPVVVVAERIVMGNQPIVVVV